MDLQFTALLGLALTALITSWFLAPGTWAQLILWSGRKAAGLHSRTIEVGNLDWHYLEGGNGGTLVALHGFGADADHWLRVAPRLRRHFHLVAPDLVGFGESSQGDDLEYDIESQVERLRRFLDQAGVDSCVMAGNSMGGWIASRFAARYPGRVSALWLLAPLGVAECEPGELLERIDHGSGNPLEIQTLSEFKSRVFQPMFARPPHLPYPLRIHYGRRALDRSVRAQSMFAQVRKNSVPLEQTISLLEIPILVQWGRQDRAVHVSGADRLHLAIRQGEVKIQDHIGHLPMLESAAQSAGQFLDFARKYRLLSSIATTGPRSGTSL